jgi:hypothetical protein
MTRFTSSALMTAPVRYAGRRVLRRGACTPARRLVNGNVKMEFPRLQLKPYNLPHCLAGSCRAGGQPVRWSVAPAESAWVAGCA